MTVMAPPLMGAVVTVMKTMMVAMAVTISDNKLTVFGALCAQGAVPSPSETGGRPASVVL